MTSKQVSQWRNNEQSYDKDCEEKGSGGPVMEDGVVWGAEVFKEWHLLGDMKNKKEPTVWEGGGRASDRENSRYRSLEVGKKFRLSKKSQGPRWLRQYGPK